jgi:hypothetical protein
MALTTTNYHDENMAGTLPRAIRPKTLEEYVTSYGEVAQHIHYDYRPRTTTKGAVAWPEHRLAPDTIRPWTSFDGEQALFLLHPQKSAQRVMVPLLPRATFTAADQVGTASSLRSRDPKENPTATRFPIDAGAASRSASGKDCTYTCREKRSSNIFALG